MTNSQPQSTTTNVVRETALRAYPGWIVREYRDGMFDSIDTRGIALSPGYESFAEAVGFAKRGGQSA